MLSATGPIFPIRLTLRLFAAAFASTADIPIPTIFCWVDLLVKEFEIVSNAPLKFAACTWATAAGAPIADARANPAPSSTKFTPITLDLRLLLFLRLATMFPLCPALHAAGPYLSEDGY